MSILVYTGYNVLQADGLISMQPVESACSGGSGSSYVFAAEKISEPGCQGIPSNPLNLSTTCGVPQAYTAIQLALEERSSFTLGFSVLCKDGQCGSEFKERTSSCSTLIISSEARALWNMEEEG